MHCIILPRKLIFVKLNYLFSLSKNLHDRYLKSTFLSTIANELHNLIRLDSDISLLENIFSIISTDQFLGKIIF